MIYLGQIPKKLLVIIGIVVAVVIIGIVIVVSGGKEPLPPPPEVTKKPVNEVLVDNVINVSLEKAFNIGSILYGSDSRYPETQDNVTTTEKFIKVVVQAQNVGKEESENNIWGIGDIIDSEGRRFPYSKTADFWLPVENECGSALKPGFTPVSCSRIYEIAKISEGLKVEVVSGAGIRAKKVGTIDLGI